MSIQQFQATLSNSARPNRFEANITLPSQLLVSSQNARDLPLRIESVSFPGKNIRTTSDDNAYGPSYEVAQGISYAEDINITFLLKSNHEERWIFNSWQDLIVSPETYDLSYYEEYATSMYVYQLDEYNQVSAGIMIRDTYPKTVNALEYSNNSTNELVKATVSMAFRDWAPLDIQYTPPTSPDSPRNTTRPTRLYPEYTEKIVTRRNVPALGRDNFPTQNRPTGIAHIDMIPPRAKGIFEDAGKAINSVLDARDQVVFAQNKVVAFKNFFKGITKSSNPLSNLGIGGFGGF